MLPVSQWVGLLSAAALIGNVSAQQAPVIISRPLLTSGAPCAITVGPDGALWFTNDSDVGRIAAAADAAEYPASADLAQPLGIASGPDGALWFTDTLGNSIDRITTAGAVTVYSLGDDDFGRDALFPEGITLGPDGAMWFTEFMGNDIGRIATDGTITLFRTPGVMRAYGITTGPDGALWFTQNSTYIDDVGNSIWRMTTAGVFTSFLVGAGPSGLAGITTGPDGALWFTESYSNKIGRITTAGAITEYPISGFNPEAIVSGADGALWFTETTGNQVGRITTAGAVTEYPVPTPASVVGGPEGIAALPDGTIWFANSGANAIGEVVFPTALLTASPGSVSPGAAITASGSGFGPGESVNLYSNSTGRDLLETVVADANGAFSAMITVPELPNGMNTVTAVGQTSSKLGAAEYTVNLNLAPGQIFADVSPTDYYYGEVNALSAQSITSGCGVNPTLYCPTENVTRAEIAIFLVRGIVGGDVFQYSPTPYFADVPANAFGFQWIQRLYELGITAGCGGGDFCPNEEITRDEMAILIVRARYGAMTPFDWNAMPYFADVPSTYYAFSWIQRLHQDGISAGCTAEPLNYCPGNPVTRGDMAILIMRGLFNQFLPAAAPYLLDQQTKTFIGAGQTGGTVITGVNTNFQQGVTQLVFPPGLVTASSVTVTSPTTMSVSVTVAAGAPVTYLPIYEVTGQQEAVSPNVIITEE